MSVQGIAVRRRVERNGVFHGYVEYQGVNRWMHVHRASWFEGTPHIVGKDRGVVMRLVLSEGERLMRVKNVKEVGNATTA